MTSKSLVLKLSAKVKNVDGIVGRKTYQEGDESTRRSFSNNKLLQKVGQIFGKSDPYFVIKSTDGKVELARSNIVMNELHPTFESVVIDISRLTENEINKKKGDVLDAWIQIYMFDWEQEGTHPSLGTCQVKLQRLIEIAHESQKLQKQSPRRSFRKSKQLPHLELWKKDKDQTLPVLMGKIFVDQAILQTDATTKSSRSVNASRELVLDRGSTFSESTASVPSPPKKEESTRDNLQRDVKIEVQESQDETAVGEEAIEVMETSLPPPPPKARDEDTTNKEDSAATPGMVALELRLHNVKNVDGVLGQALSPEARRRSSVLDRVRNLLDSSDPFIEVLNKNDYVVARSDVMMDNLNPVYAPIYIAMKDDDETMAKSGHAHIISSMDEPMYLTIYDWESSGRHKFLGHISTTLKELQQDSMVADKRRTLSVNEEVYGQLQVSGVHFLNYSATTPLPEPTGTDFRFTKNDAKQTMGNIIEAKGSSSEHDETQGDHDNVTKVAGASGTVLARDLDFSGMTNKVAEATTDIEVSLEPDPTDHATPALNSDEVTADSTQKTLPNNEEQNDDTIEEEKVEVASLVTGGSANNKAMPAGSDTGTETAKTRGLAFDAMPPLNVNSNTSNSDADTETEKTRDLAFDTLPPPDDNNKTVPADADAGNEIAKTRELTFDALPPDVNNKTISTDSDTGTETGKTLDTLPPSDDNDKTMPTDSGAGTDLAKTKDMTLNAQPLDDNSNKTIPTDSNAGTETVKMRDFTFDALPLNVNNKTASTDSDADTKTEKTRDLTLPPPYDNKTIPTDSDAGTEMAKTRNLTFDVQPFDVNNKTIPIDYDAGTETGKTRDLTCSTQPLDSSIADAQSSSAVAATDKRKELPNFFFLKIMVKDLLSGQVRNDGSIIGASDDDEYDVEDDLASPLHLASLALDNSGVTVWDLQKNDQSMTSAKVRHCCSHLFYEIVNSKKEVVKQSSHEGINPTGRSDDEPVMFPTLYIPLEALSRTSDKLDAPFIIRFYGTLVKNSLEAPTPPQKQRLFLGGVRTSVCQLQNKAELPLSKESPSFLISNHHVNTGKVYICEAHTNALVLPSDVPVASCLPSLDGPEIIEDEKKDNTRELMPTDMFSQRGRGRYRLWSFKTVVCRFVVTPLFWQRAQ